jgi:hypothetical protein
VLLLVVVVGAVVVVGSVCGFTSACSRSDSSDGHNEPSPAGSSAPVTASNESPGSSAPVTASNESPGSSAPVTASNESPGSSAPVTASNESPGSSAPVTASNESPGLSAPVTASNATLRNTAQLIVAIDPSINDTLKALDDGEQADVSLLLEELRDKSAVVWASTAGLTLASTLDEFGTTNPAYLDLRRTASVFLEQLCEHTKTNSGTMLSGATKDCVCGGAAGIPIVHCAAKADREFVEFLDNSEEAGRRHLQGCELDLDFFKLFQAATIGKPNCFAGGCEFPFPPPMIWMGFEFGAKGCVPGLDLTSFEVCDNVDDEKDCSSIADMVEGFGDTALVNFLTDQQFALEGGICLLAAKSIPLMSFVLKTLDFFDWSHCVATIELGFHHMVGYLGFELSVGIFEILRLTMNVDAQFYDDIKDKYEICLLLKNGDCAEQGGKDKGQNSCSLRAGQNRGAFSVKVNLLFRTKTHDIAKWGSDRDGTCLARCKTPTQAGAPTELWSKVGYRGTGTLPSSVGEISTANGNCIISASEIQLAPYNVIPDDGVDDSVGLQTAIDFIGQQCSGSFSQLSLIELPAGTINISTEIHLDVNFLVVRGQGSDPIGGGVYTNIVFRAGPDTVYDGIPDFDLNIMTSDQGANGGWIWPGRGVFRVQTREVHRDYLTSYGKAPANRKDFYEGSVNFHWKNGVELARTACIGSSDLELTESDTGINVGDYVWVGGANSQNMYDQQGVLSDDRICQHMRQQIFVVTNVKRGGLDNDIDNPEITEDGDTISIDKPLEFDLYTNSIADISPDMPCSNSATKSKVVKLKVVQGVGLENFYLTQVVDGHNASEAKFNYNNIAHEQAIHGIVFKWAVNSFVRNVHTYMTGSHPIVTEMAKNLQFESNVMDSSWNKGKGGNGYFRNSKLWDSLILNNAATGVRHLTLQWSSSGNVVAGNTLDCDLNLHGGWERNNLIERNVVNVPYEHRDCSPSCLDGEETWYPIWWAAGEHAGGWAGSTGPRNIFFNNILTKQTVQDGAFEIYDPYGSNNPTTVFQIGWDRRSAAGSTWEHLSIDGQNIDTWTFKETVDYSTGPSSGVNSNCAHAGSTLVGVDYTASCS